MGISYGPAARARGQRLGSTLILVEKLQAFKEKVGTVGTGSARHLRLFAATANK